MHCRSFNRLNVFLQHKRWRNQITSQVLSACTSLGRLCLMLLHTCQIVVLGNLLISLITIHLIFQIALNFYHFFQLMFHGVKAALALPFPLMLYRLRLHSLALTLVLVVSANVGEWLLIQINSFISFRTSNLF